MIEMLIKRRAAMMTEVEEERITDLTGWTINKSLTAQNFVNDTNWSSISPYYSVTPGESLTIRARNNNSSGCRGVFTTKQANGNSVSNFDLIPSATVTVPTNAKFVRFMIVTSQADDCYIKNNTTNTYIWRGKNVE